MAPVEDIFNEAIELLSMVKNDYQAFLEQFGNFEDIPGFSNYQVSDLGFIKNKKTFRLHYPRIMKDGHEHVMMADDFGKRKWVPVRFLVARRFVYNEHVLNEVDHVDGDRSNNEANNLIWV